MHWKTKGISIRTTNLDKTQQKKIIIFYKNRETRNVRKSLEENGCSVHEKHYNLTNISVSFSSTIRTCSQPVDFLSISFISSYNLILAGYVYFVWKRHVYEDLDIGISYPCSFIRVDSFCILNKN